MNIPILQVIRPNRPHNNIFVFIILSLIYQFASISCISDDLNLTDIVNSAKKDILVKPDWDVKDIIAVINHSDDYDFFIQFGYNKKKPGKELFFMDSFLKNLMVLTSIGDNNPLQILQIIRVNTNKNSDYNSNTYLSGIENNGWVKHIKQNFIYFFKRLELKSSTQNLRLFPYKETEFVHRKTNSGKSTKFFVYATYILSIDFKESFPILENTKKFYIRNIIIPITLHLDIEKASFIGIDSIGYVDTYMDLEIANSLTIIVDSFDKNSLSFKECPATEYHYPCTTSTIVFEKQTSKTFEIDSYLEELAKSLEKIPGNKNKLIDITTEEIANNSREISNGNKLIDITAEEIDNNSREITNINNSNTHDNSEIDKIKRLERKIMSLEKKIKDRENMPLNVEGDKYKKYLYVCISFTVVILVGVIGLIIFKIINMSNGEERKKVKRLVHAAQRVNNIK